MHAFVSINLFGYHYSATVIFHLSSAFKDITKFMDSHFLNLYIDCLCYNFKNSSTLKHLGHFYFLCMLHKTYFLLEELACYFKLHYLEWLQSWTSSLYWKLYHYSKIAYSHTLISFPTLVNCLFIFFLKG